LLKRFGAALLAVLAVVMVILGLKDKQVAEAEDTARDRLKENEKDIETRRKKDYAEIVVEANRQRREAIADRERDRVRAGDSATELKRRLRRRRFFRNTDEGGS
jgi:hypothetical protein